MTTQTATTDLPKIRWILPAGAAVVGAAGVGWSLAQIAGAAAAGGAALLGAVAIRWATAQNAKPEQPAQQPPHEQPNHGPDWVAPKLSDFYKDEPRSETRSALLDSGTRSGLYPLNRAPRSRTGTDL
ncbi:MAG: hypothetical protein JSR77_10870 [Planctomycetes bacterium]|nr:hypothetical protein [Planctomycetota bacterium]